MARTGSAPSFSPPHSAISQLPTGNVERRVPDLTLEDIARKAGVSRSTVSRVVNDQPYVRKEVRERVLDVIHSTGFHPNVAARTLASQRSSMIGLVLPRSVSSFFTDPYFPRLVQGIAQASNQRNYTLALFLVGTPEDEETMFLRVSRKGFLDGVLVQSGVLGEQLIDKLVSSNKPIVVVGRPFHSNDVSYIDVDNVEASYLAVTHLIQLGYRRIGTITGTFNSTVSLDRREGYLKALAVHGVPVDESLIIEGDFTEAGGYRVMKQLMTSKPEAVFAASDTMAVGAMKAVMDAGLSIPEDVAFIGFDDLPISAIHKPALTTVHQPIYEFGNRAVELLIDVIENGNTPPRKEIMDTELVIRDSCGTTQRLHGPG